MPGLTVALPVHTTVVVPVAVPVHVAGTTVAVPAHSVESKHTALDRIVTPFAWVNCTLRPEPHT